MKNIFFVFILFFLLFAPVFHSHAQNSSGSPSGVFDTTGFPQWAKDLRRWDIIAFGTFPFSMFAVTFFTDLYRWNSANRMDFSDDGRRYAPWPLKSAGAEEMTKEEYQRTILFAAGVSAVIAITDFIIVKAKQDRERRRIESRPAGAVIIDITPYDALGEEDNENTGEADILGGDSGDVE